MEGEETGQEGYRAKKAKPGKQVEKQHVFHDGLAGGRTWVPAYTTYKSLWLRESIPCPRILASWLVKLKE